MEPIRPPKTFKVYQLIKQSGVILTYGSLGTPGIGVGFYSTLQEAEHNRTLETLKDTATGTTKPKWHVFELEFPNPVYEE